MRRESRRRFIGSRFLIQQILASLCCLVGLILLIWGNWPSFPASAYSVKISPMDLAIQNSVDPTKNMLSTPDGYEVILKTPTFLRTGDDGKIVLFMNIDSDVPPDIYGDLFDSYHFMVSARLEIAGILYAPKDDVYLPIRPGQPVRFEWTIRAPISKTYEGVVWLYGHYHPKPGSQDSVSSENRLIAVPRFRLKAVNFLGLMGLPIRIIGGVLTVIGVFWLLLTFYFSYSKKDG
jgi:hypothetical protein